MLDISTIAEKVSEAVRDYPVKRVDLFGSYVHNSQSAASDVDLLVEFTSPTVSLLTLSSLRMNLEEQLGVFVDLLHAPLPKDSFLEIGETVTLYEQ